MGRFKKFIVVLAILMTLFSLQVVRAADKSIAEPDAAYANFRNVRAGKIGENSLYRSQHPANGSSRSLHANKLMEQHAIRTVLNLSDSDKSLQRYFRKEEISSSNYYRALYDMGRVYTADMSVSHNKSYRKKAVGALQFLAASEGPYLVHCEVGRDRTGFVILLLECLMGAPYSYILADYSESLVNVNDWSPEKARKKATETLSKEFRYMTGKSRKTDWSKEDLAKCAEAWLKKGGMTSEEIAALKKSLSTSYPNIAPGLQPSLSSGL